MKVSIIGAGAEALAAAAFLSVRRIPVAIYVKNKDRQQLWNTTPLTVKGVVDTSLYLPVAKTPQEALAGADLIAITVKPSQYAAAVTELTPHLRKGQALVFLNGCWGAVKAARYFRKNREALPVTLSETAAMPFDAALSADGKELTFRAVAQETAYASLTDDPRLSSFFHELSPKVTHVASPASTSLSAVAPLIRGVGILFNMGRIESGEPFHFYKGLTKRMVAYMEACDKERLAIGKSLGAPLSDILATLNAAWASHYTSLMEALTEEETCAGATWIAADASRYLTEDLPCSLTALLDLSDMIHVQAPHMAALVYTLDLYLGVKYKPFLTVEDLRAVKEAVKS